MNDIHSKIKITCEDVSQINSDIIVNAAKPTLMGGNGIDGAIHNEVNSGRNNNFLKNKILEEFKCVGDENYPRINYGEMFITDGYGRWKKIYHAVGIKSDEDDYGFCSKKKIDKLKKLYKEILNNFLRSGYKSISIPIISSGSYGLNERVARRIAYASIYNFLLDLKKENSDQFEYIEYINIFNNNELVINELKIEIGFWQKKLKYKEEMLYLSRKDSSQSYKVELKREKTGLINIIRIILFYLTKLSIISFISKHIDVSWSKRRQSLDILVILQFLFSVLILWLSNISFFLNNPDYGKAVFLTIAVYFIFEIIVSNSSLCFFNNINNVSKNGYRSLVLFMLNYSTVIVCFTIIFNQTTKLNRLSSLMHSVLLESWDNISQYGQIILTIEKGILSYLAIVGLTMILGSFFERKYKK